MKKLILFLILTDLTLPAIAGDVIQFPGSNCSVVIGGDESKDSSEQEAPSANTDSRNDNIDIRTIVGEGGRKLIVLQVQGEVATGAVVKIDEFTASGLLPIPKLGKDRFIQLTSTSTIKPMFGLYISLPRPHFGFSRVFTSMLELDDIVRETALVSKGSHLDRRFLATYMNIKLMLEHIDYNTETLEGVANVIPENFLELTPFEKKRVYEELAKEFAKLGRRLHVLNTDAVDILTRTSFTGQQ